MKTTIQLIAFCFLTVMSYGQDQETLFGNINHIGGFGGPMIEVSSINDQTVADVGGGGALILDNFFFGGYGLGNDAASVSFEEQSYDIEFGHGGLWFGFIAPPHKLAHVYTSFRLGWGDANLIDSDGDKAYSDNLLVMTPELGVELNITSWFRLAFSGGYRFVSGANTLPELSGLNDDSFSSPYGALTFRFGGFGYYDDNDDDDIDIDFDF